MDAYRELLGIEGPNGQPNRYRKLGIDDFTAEPPVIAEGAEQQLERLRPLLAGPHAALAQQLIGEVTAARDFLLDPVRRKAYDAELRATIEPSPSLANSPAIVEVQAAPRRLVAARAAASASRAADSPRRSSHTTAWLYVGASLLVLVAVLGFGLMTSRREARLSSAPDVAESGSSGVQVDSGLGAGESVSQPDESTGAAAGDAPLRGEQSDRAGAASLAETSRPSSSQPPRRRPMPRRNPAPAPVPAAGSASVATPSVPLMAAGEAGAPAAPAGAGVGGPVSSTGLDLEQVRLALVPRSAASAELSAVRRLTSTARQALARQALDEADEALDLAALLATGEDTIRLVEQTAALVAEFRVLADALERGRAALAVGDKLTVAGREIEVVRRQGEVLTLEDRGQQQRYDVDALPVPLVRAIVERQLAGDPSRAKAAVAVGLILAQPTAKAAARQLLLEAHAAADPPRQAELELLLGALQLALPN